MIIDSSSNMVRIGLPLRHICDANSIPKVNYTDNPPAYEYVAGQEQSEREWTSTVSCGIHA